MGERRKRLEESVRTLRLRLEELQARQVDDREQPIHQVAVRAVRESLTEAGRALARLVA